MRKLSLFSGIGGIDLAAHWAGMETVAFCERESYPVKVLQKNFPDIPVYDDVCTLTKVRLIEDGIIGDGRTIDIISAGYPCQPFSNAGKREGKNDDRHLWPEVKRLLEEIRPRWFVGENVAGHVTLGLDTVLFDLGDIGYTCQSFVIPSSAVGAPHRRDRVFILAYTDSLGDNGKGELEIDGYRKKGMQERKQSQCRSGNNSENVGNAASEGLQEWRQSEWEEIQKETGTRLESEFERSSKDKDVAYPSSIRQQGQRESFQSIHTTKSGERETSKPINVRIRNKWSTQSELDRVLDGLSAKLDEHRWPAGLGAEQYDWEPPRVATGVKDRVGRLKALGNAVNPHQIYPIMAAIKVIDDQIT
ncbi:DNA cytosine methyltransferase [Paenibacillus sp. FSL H7-0323]|uniref:DNA cytosine methyltransferase n=1 Tax=Paenibacillus sp. FSL H7-0323 TaxID=2921433 RepID=UPI0030FB3843